MMLGNAVVPQVIRYAWNTLINAAKNNVNGQIDVKVFKETHYPITLYNGDKTMKKTSWATPTHSTWHQYRTMTNRSTTILGNQIYYELRTETNSDVPINLRDKFYTINPNFIEFLMGYPANWTRV
jgi:hypothetical protein